MSSDEFILDENLDGKQSFYDPVNLASTGQRFVNLLIDRIVVTFLTMGYMVAMMASLGLFDNPNPDDFADGPYMTFAMFMYAIPPMYYTLMEHFFGRTLGKYVSGCKVVGEDGQRPTFANAFLRTLVRIIPVLFISAFFSSRRMWHDKWTRTYVVKTR